MYMKRALACQAATVSLAALTATGVAARDLNFAVNNIYIGTFGLEPANNDYKVTLRIHQNAFEQLTKRKFNANGKGNAVEIVPALATGWRWIDPLTWEADLRQGVKFHNGDEMTAEDIEFSFSRARLWGPQSAVPNGRRLWTNIKWVEVVDPYKIRFHLNAPDPIFEQKLASSYSWIINAREWLANGRDAYSRAPIGTGPYRITEIKDGQHVRLERFDDYWGGKAAAEHLAFIIVPDVAARINGLLNGDYDVISDVPPALIDQINQSEVAEVRSVMGDAGLSLVWNTVDGPLKDARVRQALNMAIDRKLIVDEIWNGYAAVTPNFQLEGYGPMFVAGKDYVYDPEKAKQLLEEAGYDGGKVELRYLPGYYPNFDDVVPVLVEMWQAVGFNAEAVPVENDDFAHGAGWGVRGSAESHRFMDPTGAVIPAWGPASWIQMDLGWKSPAAFNEALVTLQTSGDMEERHAAFASMLDAIDSDPPGTFLYQEGQIFGVRKDVEWMPYSLFWTDFGPDNLRFK
jgi:peptide/nickel transport system substrate-binding protein